MAKITVEGTGTDSTARVADAIKQSAGGGEVSLTGQHYIGGLEVKDVNLLTISGPGEVVRLAGAPSVFDFTNCTNFAMRGLRIDFNGVDKFGGVKFAGCSGVSLNKNHLTNGPLGTPPAVQDSDRYGFVFRRADKISKGIRIERNFTDGLQLELDHVSDVQVRKNIILNSVQTGAIGSFTVRDGTITENVTISENVIGNPCAAAVALCIDDPSNNNARFSNIEISRNVTIRSAANLRPGQHDVLVGTANVQQATKGNIFRDIFVKNNVSIIKNSQAPGAAIRFMAGDKSGFKFDDIAVEENSVFNHVGKNEDSYTFDLRFINRGSVRRNSVNECSAGLAIVNGYAVLVMENIVGIVNNSGNAYTNDYSRGFNIFADNVGGPVGREQPNMQDIMI